MSDPAVSIDECREAVRRGFFAIRNSKSAGDRRRALALLERQVDGLLVEVGAMFAAADKATAELDRIEAEQPEEPLL